MIWNSDFAAVYMNLNETGWFSDFYLHELSHLIIKEGQSLVTKLVGV